MPVYCKNSRDVAQCVETFLKQSEEIGLQLTTTIAPDKYEGYSVSAVTGTWSDDTAEKLRIFLNLRGNTFVENTQVG